MCDSASPTPAATDNAVTQPTVCEKAEVVRPLIGTTRDATFADILTGPFLWTAADFETREIYTQRLGPRDIEEIEAALRSFKSAHGLDYDEVSQGNFPLSGLALQLTPAAETLHKGHGFTVIKGLDASRYSVEDSTIIYLGLASHLADKRGLQDRKGNILSHITNSKLWDVPMQQRHGIHSSQALPFHSDMGCDVLALQVRQSARTGGYTYLASAAAVFNHILREEPEVALTLLSPNWPVQISSRRTRHYLAPVFAVHDGRLLVSLDPSRLGRHAASPDGCVPALTMTQRHALGRVSQVARLFELRLKLEAGDLLFLNNWALLHRRDAYQDGERTSRHMVRLWLRNTQLGWSIPTQMLPPWLAAYGESSASKARIYPVHPMPTYVVPKYITGSAAFVVEEADESDAEPTVPLASGNEWPGRPR
ncbi:taurine catabolism dioxygenase tauD, tfdA family protein [Hirsutella rhossiliensis]|uniref:Taurine catabolism dioxygenase tauD, tfdA family domain-containing protein n=1 Tax=Hirsutella rhossiliensis TaxID=111463 RepID=A0A9P8SJB3_9HYPO|nr:taurine catabolism dioxygenase tauD, tfdA family domain-containing protein [Hirsutella rhossiliensis]KAH0964711.1 taurine catabolism dioxygenase tauD, tfdA family domain-containing protein [Hirsutella rhossiliensis]